MCDICNAFVMLKVSRQIEKKSSLKYSLSSHIHGIFEKALHCPNQLKIKSQTFLLVYRRYHIIKCKQQT